MKVVAIGDGLVGKTCLLHVYQTNKFPDIYVPTVFDTYNKEVSIEIDGKQLKGNLILYDTAGQEDYDRLRLMTYPDTDVFLLCFSITRPDSFTNAKYKWYPDIKDLTQRTKLVLVGTKKDLREDSSALYELRLNGEHPISYEKGVLLAKELGAYAYVECSAKTIQNVDLVFSEAIKACLAKPPKKKKKCTIL